MATLLAAALAPAAARADLAPPREERDPAVNLTVHVIRASEAPGGVDPQLAPLQKRLSNFRFSSLRLVNETPVSLAVDGRGTIALPGGRRLVVTRLRPRPDDPPQKLRLHLRLSSASQAPQAALLDADYLIARGGDLLVGGPRLEDGTLLLFLHH